MFKRCLLIAVVVIGCVGGVLWQRHVSKAKAAKVEAEILKGLSADDIRLILWNQAQVDAASVSTIVSSTEKRRAFLDGMRQYLALAAQARREGLDEDPQFKVNFDYKRDVFLSDVYTVKLSAAQSGPYVVPAKQVKDYLADPAHIKVFDNTMETMRSIQRAAAQERGTVSLATKPEGESLTKAQEAWARTKIVSTMAEADSSFMALPEIGLRIKVMEAGLLSHAYLQKYWAKNITPTDREIADYLTAHPEFDLKKKRAKAEEILRRANSGEDFAKLAQQYSEDRSTKNQGGLYENVTRGYLWSQVEDAALKLEKGQLAGSVIESEVGFHIVKLEDKRVTKDENGKEVLTYSLRHILLQKKFEEVNGKNPNVPPPFMTAEEIARAQVEQAKRAKFVADVIQRNPIQLPSDFDVQLPTGSPGGASGPELTTKSK